MTAAFQIAASATDLAGSRRVKIRISSLTKSFPERTAGEKRRVLDGVDLAIMEGEFLAIVGPSGCGKSTLLSCIAGFERIDTGEVAIDGVRVDAPSRKGVFVFQEPAIFPWLTVAQNIAFGLPAELSLPEKRRIVRHHIDLVGLGGFEHALPRELSGGMKQRVEFARALAVDPDILYLDEPFGALDALTRLTMRAEIARICAAQAKTCILVTHDVEEACTLGQRIVVMSGRPARIVKTFDNDHRPPELKQRILRALGVES